MPPADRDPCVSPDCAEPGDPRRQYREKIKPYAATPESGAFTEELIRVVNVYTPIYGFLLG